jgi:hypothetical protein
VSHLQSIPVNETHHTHFCVLQILVRLNQDIIDKSSFLQRHLPARVWSLTGVELLRSKRFMKPVDLILKESSMSKNAHT